MAQEQDKRLTALYTWAHEQMEAGNWSGAVKTLQQLLAIEPQYRDAPDMLAQAHDEDTKATRLARLYEQAHERLQVGDWERVVGLCGEITALDPQYRDVCTLAEQAQQAQKKLSEVASTYRSGVTSFETGQWPTAIAMFKQVSEVDPSYRDVLVKLEMAQTELKRQARLEEQYQAGLRAIKRKQWAEAIAALEQVVAEDEAFAEGAAEEQLKQTRELLNQQQAETVARLYDAGTEYTRRGEWALAVEALEQAVAHDPEYPGVQELLLEAREKRDDQQQAEDLYEIGVQHSQRGNWAEAAAAFEETLDLIPNYRDAERRLQSARLRAERQQRAEAPTIAGIPVPPPPRTTAPVPRAAVPPPSRRPRVWSTGMIGAVILGAVGVLAVCVVLTGILAWPTVQQVALGLGEPTPTRQLSPIIITATSSPTVVGQDRMAFVQSVTVPDGTTFAPGVSFPKTWRLQNLGTRAWEGYSLAFVEGEQMGAPPEVPVPTTPAGGNVDVVVSLVAPLELGTHSGQWRLKNASGQLFGDPLHVIIQVSGTAPPPTPSPAATPTKGSPTPEQTVWPTAAPRATATATTKPTTGTPKPTSSTPKPTGTPAAGALRGRIAFPLWNPKTNRYDVQVMNADGTGQYTVLGSARQPCWNPDGTWLAVNGEIQFKENILVLKPDGSGLREVSLHVEDSRPTWSPDGKRIAFDAPGSGGVQYPFVIDDLRDFVPRATRNIRYQDRNIPGRYVTWMPNGNLIFMSLDFWATAQKTGLYAASPEGGLMWQVTTSDKDTAPAVSKSGRLAFMSRRGGESDWEIYTVSLAGGDAELKQLTNNTFQDGLPTWSPDDQYIAFVSNEGGSWGIWVMRPDGSGRRKIKDLGSIGLLDDWVDERISWAP